MLFVDCCVLLVVCCVLIVVRCSPLVVSRLWRVVSCVVFHGRRLLVVRCVLFVVCCVFDNVFLVHFLFFFRFCFCVCCCVLLDGWCVFIVRSLCVLFVVGCWL